MTMEPIRHRIALIETNDWVRVYVDGEFYGEGHSLEGVGGASYGLELLLRRLGIQMSSVWLDEDVWEDIMYSDSGDVGFDQKAAALLEEMKDNDRWATEE